MSEDPAKNPKIQFAQFHFLKDFDAEKCTQCGICFEKCPVLKLPEAKSKSQIVSLITQGKSKVVLDNCTGCFACNIYCPNDCYPYALIIKARNDRYLEKGIPARAKIALPYFEPNIFTETTAHFKGENRELIKQWEENWHNPPDSPIFIFSGCNAQLQPHILQSKVFENIPIFGSPSLCCAEPLYRMGAYEPHRQVGLRLKDEFEKMHIKKMIVPCCACYYSFTQLFPSLYGINFDFEIIRSIDWIYDGLKAQKWDITPLNKTAVIHDNCWAKVDGGYTPNRIREILELLGVTVLEPAHTKEDALCCGNCAGTQRLSLFDVMMGAKKRLHELNAIKADFIVDYCGGCNWLFNLLDGIQLNRQPIYHLLEVVKMATGEFQYSDAQRTTKILVSSMLKHVIKSYLNRKSDKITNIKGYPVNEEAPLWKKANQSKTIDIKNPEVNDAESC